jgi:hypothetical protein
MNLPTAPTHSSAYLPTAQSIPQLIFLLDHLHRQCRPNTEEHKERPLPPERVDHKRKDEPVYQLTIREEVKGTSVDC